MPTKETPGVIEGAEDYGYKDSPEEVRSAVIAFRRGWTAGMRRVIAEKLPLSMKLKDLKNLP